MKSEPNRWSRRGAPWTVRELKQLGKLPDSVLARRTGRTIKEVVAERLGNSQPGGPPEVLDKDARQAPGHHAG